MGLGKYRHSLQAMQSVLERLQTSARELSMGNAARQVDSILGSAKADAFRLVIVGEFSRGKSTFVNALLGQKILPASKNPTTAIISKIVYGEEPQYRIHYKDGQEPQDMPEAAFIKLTAPEEPDEGDPASVQAYAKAQEELARIDHAQIFYPLRLCRDNVEVVDTPGTNDLNVGRMEITYGYLNQADAVILLLAAYQPLSASEAQFLKERILGNQIQDIFFVVSHKDDLDDAEQEQEVIDFIETNLRKLLPDGFNLKSRIFLVNSLGALYARMQERNEKLTAKQEMKIPDDFSETGFPALESALGNFLAHEKGRVRLRKYNRDAQVIIQTMQHDLSVNIGIASHSADEIRQKAAEMEPNFRQAKRRAEQIVADMRLSFENAGADIGYKCHAASQAMLEKAKVAVNNLTKDMSAASMQQAIEREVTAEKKHFVDTMLKEWQETMNRESSRAQEALRAIWNDIDVEYRRSFKLPALAEESGSSLQLSVPEDARSFSEQAYAEAGKAFKDMLKEDAGFGERILSGVGAALAGAVGVVADLYAAFFGGRRETWRDKVRSEVIRAYSGQGDRMAKALKEMYQAQTEAACQSAQESVHARIDDMERQLREILRQKEAQEQDAKQQAAHLMQKQHEMHEISQELTKMIL